MIWALALSLQAAVPPPTVVAPPRSTRKLNGSFECEIRDPLNRKSSLGGTITDYSRRDDQEQLTFEIHSRGRFDFSGKFYAFKETALYKMKNWVDFDSHLVTGIEGWAQVLLVEHQDGTATISLSYAEYGAQELQKFVGFCDLDFSWTSGR